MLFIPYLIDPLPMSLDHVSVLSRVRCAGAQSGRPLLCLSRLIELLQPVCNCHSIQAYSARSFTTVRPIHADSRTLQYHVFVQDEQVGNMMVPLLFIHQLKQGLHTVSPCTWPPAPSRPRELLRIPNVSPGPQPAFLPPDDCSPLSQPGAVSLFQPRLSPSTFDEMCGAVDKHQRGLLPGVQ
jgi:hypothetical protein